MMGGAFQAGKNNPDMPVLTKTDSVLHRQMVDICLGDSSLIPASLRIRCGPSIVFHVP
jgi:hypothetical protein